MSEQAFEWKLTPTERRIAEHAYADNDGGAWRACQKVMHLRGERGPWADDVSMAMNDAMLAELRREPEATPAGDAATALALRDSRERTHRLRALLERIVGEGLGVLKFATEVERLRADDAGNRLGLALDIFGGTLSDARAELAR
jgi:hypothetical protein